VSVSLDGASLGIAMNPAQGTQAGRQLYFLDTATLSE
jgi:hypothetical protein